MSGDTRRLHKFLQYLLGLERGCSRFEQSLYKQAIKDAIVLVRKAAIESEEMDYLKSRDRCDETIGEGWDE